MMRTFTLIFMILISLSKIYSQETDSLKLYTSNKSLKVSSKGELLPVPKIERDTLSKYQITRIDSTNNLYFIYVKNNKYRYKIKSKKPIVNCVDKQKIQVGEIYQLDIRGEENNNERIHIDDSFRGDTLKEGCSYISANDIKCREDIGYYKLSRKERENYDIRIENGDTSLLYLSNPINLFNTSLNLKGLYYVKNDNGTD